MSTLVVDSITHPLINEDVPISELKQRVIKTARSHYRSGVWDPGDSYAWLPGGYIDYAPASSTSKIRFQINISFAHLDGHAISHAIFYVNGTEEGRHSISGQSPEHRHLYMWDFDSWGTNSGRIGYQVRRYGSGNRPRYNSTRHWNGSGSYQSAQTEIIIEEYIPIS